MKASAYTKICDECKSGVAVATCGVCKKDLCLRHYKKIKDDTLNKFVSAKDL